MTLTGGLSALSDVTKRMTIEFTCQKCEGSFELEASELIDGQEELECPHCGNKTSKAMLEDFTAALAEMNAQLTALSKKFTLTMTLDSDEAEEEEEEDDDEGDDDDEEDDDDDLDDDDDDDDDDDLDEDVADDDDR
jgi:DNA-directed RNA polymerase subunit RPC12/RpoP